MTPLSSASRGKSIKSTRLIIKEGLESKSRNEFTDLRARDSVF